MPNNLHTLPEDWIEEVVNLAAECMVVVDRDGIILYINQAYCEFLNVTEANAAGRPVQEVIENSRMQIVAKTGKAEVASIHPINGSEMVANRYPLFVKGELVGAVGTVMFRNPEEWLDYSRRLQPLLEELKYYKTKFEKELYSKYHFGDLIGESPKFTAAKRLAERVSDSHSAVLLLGASGTGKELFAHSIHQASKRNHAPFMRVNCGSIPEHLFESEIFGYEEGSFTGAKKGGKKGKFELASGGTIFLDEIGDLPLQMQTKLLRVLQEKEIERIGGRAPVPLDVRVIAATHRNLEEMVRNGQFREDLYYRLNVIKIDIPSLKERIDDLGPLAAMLLKKLEDKFHRPKIQMPEETLSLLRKHSWPGNIRELENVLERAVNVMEGTVIYPEYLPLYLQEGKRQSSSEDPHSESWELFGRKPEPLKETMQKAEKKAIIDALAICGGNKKEAAAVLGIGKTSLYEKCRLYELSGKELFYK
ncbi:sigma 54-interacting transcriptional regulator [Metabacillus sp. GX 13764]|uniref:sigma-54 interaction domain-containing protein n=1 Tax=Metabacillus kandeliae TaxID=2900151 RepID=UPI001E2D5F03|nr:sigma 54-interacting transcriptional regulator [Metabacillus kandeliae]MCD7035559.1 sigma 54-interacting transcriptional regulator [Metabacillus kandeliae]